MYSKIRLRGSLFLLPIALSFLSGGECGSNRIMRRESSSNFTEANSTKVEVVTLEPQVKSKGQKLVLRTNKAAAVSDGFNFENVVTALISSPEAMGQLGKLKEKVMHYFEKKPESPEARGHGGYGQYGSPFGHGIGFPSLEGALLALAFLTFAVFLIDLIQQMIGRYHSGSASPLLGRKRRDLTESPIGILRNDPHLSTLTSEVVTSIESPLFHTYDDRYF